MWCFFWKDVLSLKLVFEQLFFFHDTILFVWWGVFMKLSMK